MARTAIGFLLAASVLAPAWLSLEAGPGARGRALALVALALAATLAASVLRRRLLAAGAVALASVAALGVAFERPLRDALPGTDGRFFGPVVSSFRQGFLDFFDTRVPFDAAAFPTMRGAALLAVFAFTLAAGLALAARRPLLAVAVVVLGTGWPTTMSLAADETGLPLLLGAAVLAVSLALLVLVRGGVRRLAPAALVGIALVAVAVAGSTRDAVAKEGFVDWTSWDLYDRPDDPVDVRYVWNANYDGIRFPEKKTTVFTVQVEGLKRSLYWRATTLDDFTGSVWRESLETDRFYEAGEEIDVTARDPFLPSEALDRDRWVRQDVRIEALVDSRLLGSSQAVLWEADDEGRGRVLATNGTVRQEGRLERGQRYTVWSYVPRGRPRALHEAGTGYPAELVERYLRILPGGERFGLDRWEDVGAVPPFARAGRHAEMRERLDSMPYFRPYRNLYRTARRVTSAAASPYEAAVALEAWFRGSEGGFVYDEQPPVRSDREPLPHFLQTKRGYCQHYAGAMALMLRYLGVPARVAAGFTSGTYDEGAKEWRVTDHNAHTWVEVFFPGHGWIPFDPTPGRGELSAAYSPFSAAFDAAEAGQLGEGLTSIPEVREQVERANALEQREGDVGGAGAGGAAAAAVERGRGVAGFVLLGLAGAAAGLLLLKEARRRARYASRDPRRLAAACRRDLAGYLADQGIAVPASATARELGALAEGRFRIRADRFVAALTEARYGPPPEARRGARVARKELGRVRGALRARLGPGARLRGAFRLRSLSA